MSNAVTVSGINAAAAISITGGEYSIGGGAYTSSAGTVSNGQALTVRLTSSGWTPAPGVLSSSDTVQVRHTANVGSLVATLTTLTIGTVTGTYTTITKP